MATLPAKLSSNPLLGLDSILWLKVDKTKKTLIDCGSLRNYTTITTTGTNTVFTPGELSTDSSYNDNKWFLLSNTTNAFINVNFNSKFYIYLRDLILHYPLYITTDGYINLVSSSILKNTTLYNSGTMLNIFNLLYTKYQVGNKRFTSLFSVAKDSNTTYTNKNTILSNSLLNNYAAITDRDLLSYSRMIMKFNYNSSNENQILSWNSVLASNSSSIYSNYSYNPSYYVRLYTYNTGSDKVGWSGIGMLCISAKNKIIPHWDYDLNNKHKEFKVAQWDYKIYPNLIRHIYNNDPLCFIFR